MKKEELEKRIEELGFDMYSDRAKKVLQLIIKEKKDLCKFLMESGLCERLTEETIKLRKQVEELKKEKNSLGLSSSKILWRCSRFDLENKKLKKELEELKNEKKTISKKK